MKLDFFQVPEGLLFAFTFFMGERGGGRGEKNHFRRSHVTRAGKSVALGQFIIERGGDIAPLSPGARKETSRFSRQGRENLFCFAAFQRKV